MAGLPGENTIASERFRVALRDWIETSGKTQKQAIADLGLPGSSIKNFLSRTASLSLGKMEYIAQKIGKDLIDMLNEGRAILEGDERHHEHDTEPPEFSPEQQRAIEAFKICLKMGGEGAEMLAKNAIDLANKKQADSGFIGNAEKRRSA